LVAGVHPLATRKTVSKFKKYQPKIKHSPQTLANSLLGNATKLTHQNGVLDQISILVDASINSFSQDG
jgi:hypothetical protein